MRLTPKYEKSLREWGKIRAKKFLWWQVETDVNDMFDEIDALRDEVARVIRERDALARELGCIRFSSYGLKNPLGMI